MIVFGILNSGFVVTIDLAPGRAALGKLVIRTRKDPSVQKRVARWLKQSGLVESTPHVITQKQFADWISATSGVPVSEGAIGGLNEKKGTPGRPPAC